MSSIIQAFFPSPESDGEIVYELLLILAPPKSFPAHNFYTKKTIITVRLCLFWSQWEEASGDVQQRIPQNPEVTNHLLVSLLDLKSQRHTNQILFLHNCKISLKHVKGHKIFNSHAKFWILTKKELVCPSCYIYRTPFQQKKDVFPLNINGKLMTMSTKLSENQTSITNS